jgi:hypothetical protein
MKSEGVYIIIKTRKNIWRGENKEGGLKVISTRREEQQLQQQWRHMTQNNAQSSYCVLLRHYRIRLCASLRAVLSVLFVTYHGFSLYKTKTLAWTRSNDDFTQIGEPVPILTSLRIRILKDKRLTVT